MNDFLVKLLKEFLSDLVRELKIRLSLCKQVEPKEVENKREENSSENEENYVDRLVQVSLVPFDSFKHLKDTTVLYEILKDEEPQLIAVIGLHLKPQTCAEFLEHFDNETSLLILTKMKETNPDKFNKDALLRMENFIAKKIEMLLFKEKGIDTTDFTSKVIHSLSDESKETKTVFLSQYPDVAEYIEKHPFDEFLSSNVDGMMKFLHRVTENEILAYSLMETSPEVKDLVFSSMPLARKIIIEDTLESLRYDKIRIRKSQEELISLYRQLKKEGKV